MDTDDIIISYIKPPVPSKSFDWRATRKSYEPGWPTGYGNDPITALFDLLENEQERSDATGDSGA